MLTLSNFAPADRAEAAAANPANHFARARLYARVGVELFGQITEFKPH